MKVLVRVWLVATLALLVGALPLAAQDLNDALAHLQRQDYATAVPMLRSLAEKGDADAGAYLGGLYLVGVGVPHDPAAARVWLEKAANGGNATAAFNLGLMYEKGDSVVANPEKAFHWYEQAASGGFPAAQLKAGKAYLDGWGTAPNPEKAAALLKEAAEAGDPDAQNLYAIMIAKKETAGTSAEAYAWFLVAEHAGQPEAARNRGLLRPELSDAELAEAEDKAQHWQPTPAR